ncbi:hypothetical protein BDR03DRAFT_974063 [Suillus americanus]|nr:hypothetical protein BDR03DRAFT_974063 [Suillus americanus]
MPSQHQPGCLERCAQLASYIKVLRVVTRPRVLYCQFHPRSPFDHFSHLHLHRHRHLYSDQHRPATFLLLSICHISPIVNASLSHQILSL